MKWWKYCWAVIGNIIFITILSTILSNVGDIGTKKLLASGVIIYLTIIYVGVALTKQIGAGFISTLLILQSIVKKNTRTEAIDEDQNFKDELDMAITKTEKDLKIRNVQIIINGCFSLIVFIWMLTILLAAS